MAWHGANHALLVMHTLQDEESKLGAAVERTARVMERMAYQNSELELLMDYKVTALTNICRSSRRMFGP